MENDKFNANSDANKHNEFLNSLKSMVINVEESRKSYKDITDDFFKNKDKFKNNV